MYIVNLLSMEKRIKAYLTSEKEKINKEYEVLDKQTKYMCDLEVSFTEDLLKLIDNYKQRLDKVTDILIENSKEGKNESSSTNRTLS